MSFEDVDIPEIKKFRSQVDRIKNQRDRVLLELMYLAASRACEVSTRVIPSDLKLKKSQSYGRSLEWKLTTFEGNGEWGKLEKQKRKVLLIKSAVAKRKAETTKIIALPCHPLYEPWTKDLLKWILKRGTLRMDITRHRIRQILRKHLGTKIFKLPSTNKRFCSPLRHFRITHLKRYYRFEPMEIICYAGWSLKGGLTRAGMPSGQLSTYLHLDWRDYYPRLLKPIADLS